MNYKLPYLPKSYLHWGEWAIDEIDVTIFSKKFAHISYEKYELNAYRRYKNICLWFWERRKGITLEQKILKVKAKLIEKLIKENKQITENRRLMEKINGS